tara:strand:- start:42 stop:923 length:882 start_codon:yes stop_codon:yes gene_type:complete
MMKRNKKKVYSEEKFTTEGASHCASVISAVRAAKAIFDAAAEDAGGAVEAEAKGEEPSEPDDEVVAAPAPPPAAPTASATVAAVDVSSLTPLERLSAFYAVHDATKDCTTLINKYSGKEEKLFAALAKKYGEDALAATDANAVAAKAAAAVAEAASAPPPRVAPPPDANGGLLFGGDDSSSSASDDDAGGDPWGALDLDAKVDGDAAPDLFGAGAEDVGGARTLTPASAAASSSGLFGSGGDESSEEDDASASGGIFAGLAEPAASSGGGLFGGDGDTSSEEEEDDDDSDSSV